MRLGGPIFTKTNTPEAWATAVNATGYRAAFSPVGVEADNAIIKAYAAAANKADIVISEVGVWNNPLDPDPSKAAAALEKCKASLLLADKIGASCCVNIAGSCGDVWYGHHADNLTDKTFDRIVVMIRDIIDTVKPTRSFYTLETMPWMYPDSVESYLRLIKAIDRKRFAVHLDPVNLICSPQYYFTNGQLLKECFQKLGPHIKSCHAKDILLHDKLTVQLEEVVPGKGQLDYPTFLKELNNLDADIPLMLEHLANETEYNAAASHIRSVATKENISL